MKRNSWIIKFFAAMTALLLVSTAAFAEIDKLTISQMVQNGNDVSIYVNALAPDESPVTEGVDTGSFTVSTNIGDPMPAAAEICTADEGVAYIFCVDVSGSVTDNEVKQIHESMNAFVGGMSVNDYVRIIAAGEGVETLCDFSRDPAVLTEAIGKIGNKAKKTYLYKGLYEALESTRKSIDGLPKRAAIIVFTDGVDDSDNSMSVDEVLELVDEIRVPIYVVGLKGNDSSASLSTVGRIARNSGGIAYSYKDKDALAAVDAIKNVMASTYVLNVQPAYEYFGRQEIVWKVNYNCGYSLSSASYVFPLTMENVVEPTSGVVEVTPEPATPEPATPEPVTEAPATPEPVTPEPVTPEPVTPEPITPEPVTPEPVTPEPITPEPVTPEPIAVELTTGSPTEAPAEEPTEAPANTTTDAPAGIQINMLGDPTEAPADVPAAEKSIVDKIIDFVMEYLFIIIAGVLVLAALVIVLVIVLRNRRHHEKRDEYSVMPMTAGADDDMNSLDDEALPTIAQASNNLLDDAPTISNFGPVDSEATVAEAPKVMGVPLEFLIECEGQQRFTQKTLFDHIVLGRGTDCDVVLDSKSTSRQHAVIINSISGMSVKDLGSRNKTYLNGNEITAEMPLQDGDVLKLGSTIVQVKIVQ